MDTELSGPRLEPKSGGPARQLVVFVHSYGAEGNDLIDIGRSWADFLPDAAFGIDPEGLRHGGAFLARRFAP